jgi:Phage terminase, small subunit
MRQQPPPIDFDEDARAVWSAAQRQLRLQGTWTKPDGHLLAFYVRSVQLAQRARTAADRLPFQRGAHGGMLGHVEMKVAEGAEAAALKYATALLLTPESRRRHGVTLPDGAEDALSKLIG